MPKNYDDDARLDRVSKNLPRPEFNEGDLAPLRVTKISDKKRDPEMGDGLQENLEEITSQTLSNEEKAFSEPNTQVEEEKQTTAVQKVETDPNVDAYLQQLEHVLFSEGFTYQVLTMEELKKRLKSFPLYLVNFSEVKIPKEKKVVINLQLHGEKDISVGAVSGTGHLHMIRYPHIRESFNKQDTFAELPNLEELFSDEKIEAEEVVSEGQFIEISAHEYICRIAYPDKNHVIIAMRKIEGE